MRSVRRAGIVGRGELALLPSGSHHQYSSIAYRAQQQARTILARGGVTARYSVPSFDG
jgi:hypothetical protein